MQQFMAQFHACFLDVLSQEYKQHIVNLELLFKEYAGRMSTQALKQKPFECF